MEQKRKAARRAAGAVSSGRELFHELLIFLPIRYRLKSHRSYCRYKKPSAIWRGRLQGGGACAWLDDATCRQVHLRTPTGDPQLASFILCTGTPTHLTYSLHMHTISYRIQCTMHIHLTLRTFRHRSFWQNKTRANGILLFINHRIIGKGRYSRCYRTQVRRCMYKYHRIIVIHHQEYAILVDGK